MKYLISLAHVVWKYKYHVVWCPKYLFRILLGGVAVGIPVKDSALNSFERPRVPVD